MKIVYRPAAVNDIAAAADYISDVLKNPIAASKFKDRILAGIALLRDNPLMGMLLSDKFDSVKNGYRFIVINKHLVFYRLYDETVEIVRVLDGRTDYLSHLF